MTGGAPKAVFNIGSQHGNIHNIAGDMNVHGNQQYTAAPTGLIQHELQNIGQILDTLDLTPEIQGHARALLAAAGQEVSQPDHHEHKAARLIGRLAGYLKEFGAMSAGGTALGDCFHRLAQLLGPAGASIMHLVS